MNFEISELRAKLAAFVESGLTDEQAVRTLFQEGGGLMLIRQAYESLRNLPSSNESLRLIMKWTEGVAPARTGKPPYSILKPNVLDLLKEPDNERK